MWAISVFSEIFQNFEFWEYGSPHQKFARGAEKTCPGGVLGRFLAARNFWKPIFRPIESAIFELLKGGLEAEIRLTYTFARNKCRSAALPAVKSIQSGSRHPKLSKNSRFGVIPCHMRGARAVFGRCSIFRKIAKISQKTGGGRLK